MENDYQGKPETDQPTMLTKFNEQLGKGLLYQLEKLRMVEDRLHRIVDKRVPEKNVTLGEKSSEIIDMNGQLQDRLKTLDMNNSIIERIAQHLSEII